MSVVYSRGICYPNLTKNIKYDHHGPYMLHAKFGPEEDFWFLPYTGMAAILNNGFA